MVGFRKVEFAPASRCTQPRLFWGLTVRCKDRVWTAASISHRVWKPTSSHFFDYLAPTATAVRLAGTASYHSIARYAADTSAPCSSILA